MEFSEDLFLALNAEQSANPVNQAPAAVAFYSNRLCTSVLLYRSAYFRIENSIVCISI